MKKWNSSQISNQDGKTVIVTGSSSGIGFEAARVLASKGAEVIIAVRNLQKGENAVAKILMENPKVKPILMQLDLANLKSVRDFAEKFKSKYKYLDLLINNAGVMVPPYTKTTDGFELQFGTNHLGHFALTAQLFAHLKATPGSRIVNVSSVAHNMGNLDFSDLNWEKRKYKKWKAYGDSKIANLYFTLNLSERLSNNGNNPMVVSAHPGWTATELMRNTGFLDFFKSLFAQSIKMGTLPTLYAALAEDINTGDFIGPDGFREMKGYPVKVKSNDRAKNKQIAQKLWKKSEEMTNIKFDPA